MYTLGIETSCDETSCAVLKNKRILSNATVSSLKEHVAYGGVVPEIATRAHLKAIDKVLNFSLKKAKISLSKIDLIAATHRPGLIGALVVGLNFAKALSLALRKPFLGINHLQAHVFSPFLNTRSRIKFPFLGVVISGGHTDIYRVDDFDKIKTIGQTRDDACGEVFDKVARAYGLGYPGGPVIDKLFNPKFKDDFKFKCGKSGLDLSFSGIKTALLYKKIEMEKHKKLSLKTKKRIISSFQFIALEAIIETILEAAQRYKIKHISCGGGVLANSYLRKRLFQEERARKLKLFISPIEYAGDNAAMVAGLGFYLYNKKGIRSSISLKAQTN